MSKGNIFLGFGRGKVGDVVFSRQNGEQITRARNRSPKNPQSPLQLLQRVLMKTNSLGYSMLRPLSDHAFQGVNQGTPSQSRFSVLNIAAMRSQLAEIINSGDAEQILTSNETNFALRDAVLPPVYPFIVSEGTIPTLRVGFVTESDNPVAAVNFSEAVSAAQTAITYQQVVNALGLQRGDQLTFVMMAVDDSATAVDAGYYNGIQYARVILEPSTGEMTAPFFSEAQGGGIVVNLPNAKNEGSIQFAAIEGTTVQRLPVYSVNGIVMEKSMNSVCGAFTCIASRESGGVWQRSLQKLTVRPSGQSGLLSLEYDNQVYFLGDAIRSYLTSQSSLLYLNQAEG